MLIKNIICEQSVTFFQNRGVFLQQETSIKNWGIKFHNMKYMKKMRNITKLIEN